MKRLKLRYILPIALVALVAVAGLVFFLLTKGTVYEEDGLTLNSRIHMTNVRVEGDKVYCTIQNDTCRTIAISLAPQVQKKVDGTWTETYICGPVGLASVMVKPFSEYEQSFYFDRFVEDYVGEYRLFGAGAVGYLTITEEMAAALPDYKIHHTDGIKQTELIYVENVQFDNGEIKLTLHNDMSDKMSVPIGGEVQKKVNGEWVYYQSIDNKNSKPTVLEGNAQADCTFLMDTTADKTGEYRLILCVSGYGPIVRTDQETKKTQLEFNEESVYVIGAFTIDEEIFAPAPGDSY